MKDPIVSAGVTYGIVNGLLAILIMYGSWAAGIQTFVSVQFYTLFIPYMIVVLVVAGLQLRKANGGFLPLQQAIKFTFLSYVVAGVLVALATYVLYNILDKGLTEASFRIGLDKTRAMMEKMHVSQEDIDKAIEKQQHTEKSTGFKQVFLGLGLGLIWDFVKSLLISIAIRKEQNAFPA